MDYTQKLVFVILASTAVQAIQPSAPTPQKAPLRDLPWSNQINFLHTTDTHGWHAGHLQEASFGADWGDYISFAHHLRERADADGSDLLLVDTGDKVEGNGLYDSSQPKGKYTYPIFKGADIDIITCGNHELYKQNTSEAEYKHIIPHYKDRYVSSNIDIVDPKTQNRVPLAQRFRKFTTKNQGIRIMAFGFIFDFKGSSDHAFVQNVEDTIKEDWFQEAIRDRDVDLFVVTGHATARGKEFAVIYDAIRKQRWDSPIMFFGGHLHIRDYAKLDNKAYALASGRYHETIGFQSISGLTIGGKDVTPSASPSFDRRYIDNNLFSLYHHSGKNATTFPTGKGKNVTATITEARKKLHLDQRFGCAPKDLWTNRAPYPGEGSDDSVFTWLEKDVLPEMVVDKKRSDKPRIVMANTGTMRFDVFKGAFTRDTTFIIQPFTNGFRYLKDVPFGQADRLLEVLNKGGQILDAVSENQGLKDWMLLPLQQVGRFMSPYSSEKYHTIKQGSGRKDLYGGQMQKVMVPSANPDDPELTPGYTTIDDAGQDGDDTVHSAVQFYSVPNVFEARVNISKSDDGKPETVDLVFLDFIQPWVLAGLRFLGGTYTVNDTVEYAAEEDFTTMISTWVGRHWNDTDC